MHCTLEVCVDSTASALAAKRGGADRLELCADLIIGGTTPSPALLRQVKAETGLPVRALLRPRFGDFCYDRWELAQMAQSAARRWTQTPCAPSMPQPGRRQKKHTAPWTAPCTVPLMSVVTPLPHWKPQSSWGLLPF